MTKIPWMQAMAVAVVLGATAGCQTDPATGRRRPASGLAPQVDRETKAFLARAADPRLYSITLYQQEQDDRLVVVNGNRIRAGRQAGLPFLSPAGTPIPLVEAKTDRNQPCQVLFDASTPYSWSATDRSMLLGLVPLGPPVQAVTPTHVIDNVPGYLSVIPALQLDRVSMDAVLVYSRPVSGSLWPLSRHASAGGAAVVFGFDLMRSFSYVQWDYPTRLVLLGTGAPYEATENRVAASMPLDPETGVMAVKASFDGRLETAVLDTAGDYEVAMPDPPSALLKQVTIGEVVFRQVRAASARELGLGQQDLVRIGARLLSRYCITFDVRKNVVYFEIPDAGVPKPL